VTTPEIGRALTQRIHFNTFGGNPVGMVVGKAVLEVIEREKLQENACRLGTRLLSGLEKLKQKYVVIGDVRGKGLLLGMELVKNRSSKEPATAECAQVLENARNNGLLLGKGGLWSQTIRLAPPLCITQADADFALDVLDASLAEI
jgi:alanine-glyoxylate transaminase / (R)-3-amino-2-methylpropionate-pyruvate transaminase